MSERGIILCTCVVALFASGGSSAQAQSALVRPNDVGGELGGKALVVSASYQRKVTPRVGLQVGYMGFGDAPNEDTAEFVFPLGGNVYLSTADHPPFATAGMTVVKFPGRTETFPYAGLGFERRSSGRFLFRATLYALFADDDDRSRDIPLPRVGRTFIWPGLYFGYAF